MMGAINPIINPNTGKEYFTPKGRAWMTNSQKIENWIKVRKKIEGLVAEIIELSQEIIAEDIDKSRERN